MLVVGLTGGIASGKSTVGKLFEQHHVPVIDFDELAREVVAPGEPLLEDVFARFGADLRLRDGQLNRRALRERIFNDPVERVALQQLLHPAIRARFAQRLQSIAHQQAVDYVVAIIPLLVESKLTSMVDQVIVVDCDPATQLTRLMQRDQQSLPQAEHILAAQASRQERLALADWVIDNAQDQTHLNAQVSQLHTALLARARAGSASAE
jgi:dephospho-CoA kinase